MFARTMDGIWREHLHAVSEAWQRFTHPEATDRAGDDDRLKGRAGDDGKPRMASRLHRRIVGGLTAALAVLALTYSAASALVSGAAHSSTVRNDYAMALQAASAKYRKARAECLALPVERRDACIAEAHADETRSRSAALSAPRKVLASWRSQNALLASNAGAYDGIVIEPACNVVLRGNAGVCEIQIKGSTLDAQNAVTDSRLLQARARTQDASKPVSFAQRLTGGPKERDHYFTNVAVISP